MTSVSPTRLVQAGPEQGARAEVARATPVVSRAPAPVLATRERADGGWLALLSPWRTAASLYRTRELLWGLATRAIAERHKGSALGLVWLVAQPLLMLSVYTFVFSVVWKATWTVGEAGAGAPASAGAAMLSFASMVFAGLVVYEIFSSSVVQSPTVIVQNPNYVKKVVFPVELLPLSNVLSAVLLSLVGVGVLVVGRLLLGAGVSRTLWLLPLVLVPLALLAGGVSLLVAALGTYFRDIRPIVQGVLLQVLFFMTPIFYPPERVPEWLREYLLLNPLAGLVHEARKVLVLGELPAWGTLAVLAGVSLLVFQIGYAFFMRAKRGFSDVL